MTLSWVCEIIILRPAGKDLRQQGHIRSIRLIRGQQQTLDLNFSTANITNLAKSKIGYAEFTFQRS